MATNEPILNDISLPPPSPARFVTRTIRRNLLNNVDRHENSHPYSIHVTSEMHCDTHEPKVDSDITDMNDTSSFRTFPADEYDMDKKFFNEDEYKDSLLKSSYSFEPAAISPLSQKSRASRKVPKSGKGQRVGPHSSVAAPVVFARDAASLYLPRLDETLATLPRSQLCELVSQDSAGMFPPMNKLANSGLTLDDLEANSTPAPAWRNRKTILSAVMNFLLGILVSSLSRVICEAKLDCRALALSRLFTAYKGF